MFSLVYDNETEVIEPEATEEQPEANGEVVQEPVKKQNKTYTQEELDKLLDTERKKVKGNNDKLLKDLTRYRESLNLTEEQKTDLQSHIERLTNENLTAQEVARREKDKIVKDFQKELDKSNKRAEQIWNMYSDEKVERELSDAANENDAISAVQIRNFLKPVTKVVQDLNKEGQPTDKWVSKVSFTDKNEQGEIITIQLSPNEAVRRMKDMPEHWNLFKSSATSGLGSSNSPPNTAKGSRPPSDPVAHRQWLKQQGINLRG